MTSQVFTPLFSLSQKRAFEAVEEHKEIVTAIAGRDGNKAENLAKIHIRSTVDRLKVEKLREEEIAENK